MSSISVVPGVVSLIRRRAFRVVQCLPVARQTAATKLGKLLSHTALCLSDRNREKEGQLREKL